MHIGFNLPNSGPLSNPAVMSQIAREGEAMGFDYLTLTDHVVLPDIKVPGYPYSESGEFYEAAPTERHEQLIGMAWIAARPGAFAWSRRCWWCRIGRLCSPPRCWPRSTCCPADGWWSASARAG